MNEEKTLLDEEAVVPDIDSADTPDTETAKTPADESAGEETAAPETVEETTVQTTAVETVELAALPEEPFVEEPKSTKKRRPNKKTLIIAAVSAAAVVIVAVSGILIRNAVESKKAVDAVIASINNIGTVENNDECKALIDNAAAEYSSLSEKQQSKVTNYSSLTSAQNTYQSLVALEEYETHIHGAVAAIRLNITLYIADALDDTRQVWYNAIYKKYDEYNKGDYSDFNNALEAFYLSDEHQKRLDSMKSMDDTLTSTIAKLQNPPEQYKSAYDAFTKLYGAYSPLYDEARNPSGSFNSFTTKLNTLITNYNTAEAEMKAILPD